MLKRSRYWAEIAERGIGNARTAGLQPMYSNHHVVLHYCFL
jgi:hypothetical protein